MGTWWPFGNIFSNATYTKTDYAAYKDYTSTYESPCQPTMWELTTTTLRVKPFYHPAAYSKRWKR